MRSGLQNASACRKLPFVCDKRLILAIRLLMNVTIHFRPHAHTATVCRLRQDLWCVRCVGCVRRWAGCYDCDECSSTTCVRRCVVCQEVCRTPSVWGVVSGVSSWECSSSTCVRKCVVCRVCQKVYSVSGVSWGVWCAGVWGVVECSPSSVMQYTTSV